MKTKNSYILKNFSHKVSEKRKSKKNWTISISTTKSKISKKKSNQVNKKFSY